MMYYQSASSLTRPQGTSYTLQRRAAMVILLHEHSIEHARYVEIIGLSRSRLLMMNRWYCKSRQRYRHILSEDRVHPFRTLTLSYLTDNLELRVRKLYIYIYIYMYI
jgi:hypothetical protein